MKKLYLLFIIGGILATGGIAAQTPIFWFPNTANTQLQPVVDTWGIAISGTSTMATTTITHLTVTTCVGCGGSGASAWTTTTWGAYFLNDIVIGANSTTSALFWFATSTKILSILNNISLATTGDAYIYFDAGAEYLLWDDGGANFFFTDDIVTNDTIVGSNISVASSTLWSLSYSKVNASSSIWDNAVFVSAASSTVWSLSYSKVNASSSIWDNAVFVSSASSTLWSAAYVNSLGSSQASSTLWSLAYSKVNASSSVWDKATYISAASSTSWSKNANTVSINITGNGWTFASTVETMFRKQKALTITKVYCNSQNGTTSVQLYERTDAVPNSGGTALLSAVLSCSGNGLTASTTSFADSAIAVIAPVVASTTANSGAPGNTNTYIYVDYNY